MIAEDTDGGTINVGADTRVEAMNAGVIGVEAIGAGDIDAGAIGGAGAIGETEDMDGGTIDEAMDAAAIGVGAIGVEGIDAGTGGSGAIGAVAIDAWAIGVGAIGVGAIGVGAIGVGAIGVGAMGAGANGGFSSNSGILPSLGIIPAKTQLGTPENVVSLFTVTKISLPTTICVMILFVSSCERYLSSKMVILVRKLSRSLAQRRWSLVIVWAVAARSRRKMWVPYWAPSLRRKADWTSNTFMCTFRHVLTLSVGLIVAIKALRDVIAPAWIKLSTWVLMSSFMLLACQCRFESEKFDRIGWLSLNAVGSVVNRSDSSHLHVFIHVWVN